MASSYSIPQQIKTYPSSEKVLANSTVQSHSTIKWTRSRLGLCRLIGQKRGKKTGVNYKEEHFNFLHLKFSNNRRAPWHWKLDSRLSGWHRQSSYIALMLFGGDACVLSQRHGWCTHMEFLSHLYLKAMMLGWESLCLLTQHPNIPERGNFLT